MTDGSLLSWTPHPYRSLFVSLCSSSRAIQRDRLKRGNLLFVYNLHQIRVQSSIKKTEKKKKRMRRRGERGLKKEEEEILQISERQKSQAYREVEDKQAERFKEEDRKMDKSYVDQRERSRMKRRGETSPPSSAKRRECSFAFLHHFLFLRVLRLLLPLRERLFSLLLSIELPLYLSAPIQACLRIPSFIVSSFFLFFLSFSFFLSLIFLCQDYLSRSEASYILNADNHFLVPKSGDPLRGLIQDFCLAGCLLTARDTFLDIHTFQTLVSKPRRNEKDTLEPRKNSLLRESSRAREVIACIQISTCS